MAERTARVYLGQVPSLYLETSVVSYLAARPSRDIIVAARQQVAHHWWRARRGGFILYASQAVVEEAAAGDPPEAARRLALIAGLPLLDITEETAALAQQIQQIAAFPARAVVDALHVALAAAHGMDYLLTLNLRHIANAERRPRIERACRAAGVAPPLICTPDELMGDNRHG